VGKRRKGREIVLQATYASLISGASLQDTLKDQLNRRESADETSEFAEDLVNKIQLNRVDLEMRRNELLKKSNWSPERLGVLEKVILLIGLAELVHSPDVPVKVTINEALELTRRYCDEKAVGFINGVLDNAAHRIYPDGIPNPKSSTPDEESS
jgi:transcription antitermination protein NusB